ncbi:MAG: glycosyl hydrolase [bacterium]|nr:glycosyl hydrolase [bacterium]
MKKTFGNIFDKLSNPDNVYRGAPFWAWNGELNPEELRWQIRIMKEMGLGGFFMHSRVGLNTEYLSQDWFNCINACAEEAEKLNMFAYLYDEDRWPSGAAGGLVTKNPKYRMKYLCMKIIKDPKRIKWTKNIAGIFEIEFENELIKNYRKVKQREKLKPKDSMVYLVFTIETQKESPWYNGYTYLDTMNHEAVKEFIKTTYEKYKEFSGKYFGKVIPGIFTDEPNYGAMFYVYQDKPEFVVAVPWTEKLPIVFKKRYGYEILDFLPEIYFDILQEKISIARYHYHDCITHLFVDAFAKQIGQWCEKNNLLFTGHVLSEETLSSQTNVVGSCMRFYEYMQAPGMDLLTEHRREFNTAKQVSSIARQFGRKWRLTETYGCTGWDFPFAGHKALGDWQIALGINLRCQHLSWYTMLGEAKRDYPASIFYQSPWWQFYNKVEDYFARIHLIMTNGQEVRNLLVIHPIESMWCIFRMPQWNMEKKIWERQQDIMEYDKMFENLCDTLLASHIDFDYGDEEILSKWAKISRVDGQPVFKVNKAIYKAILVPPLHTIRSSTLKILKQFKDAGGKVIFVEKFPEYVDARKTEVQHNEFKLVPTLKEAISEIDNCTRTVSITDQSGNEIKEILYLLREDKKAFYLFVCNTSMEWKSFRERHATSLERNISYDSVVISGNPSWKYPPFEIDPDSGKVYYAEVITKNSGYAIRTSFAPIGSRLFVIPKIDISIPAQKKEKFQEIEKHRIEKEYWKIMLSESNVCVLDKPLWKIQGRDWQTEQEILRIDREVRKALGISLRGGAMIQPWARKQHRKVKTINVTLKYVFEIETLPDGEIQLAIEKPELYKIFVNGTKIHSNVDYGWWVDKSLRVLKIDPSILITGKNELILETLYSEDHPGFEIIYLLGNFGVKISNNNPVIIQKPEKIKIGDWTQQGLIFYSGNITYLHEISAKVEENQKIFLNIPEYRAAAIRILIDGKQAGIIAWPPNNVDITEFIKDGKAHTLGIELLGHRRNSHGPLHFSERYPVWTGPYQFVAEREEFYQGYQIVPCGLMKEPEIVRYKIL